MLTQRAVRRLILVQSILVGLQTVAAASILGEIVGPKYAALFIVLVAGAQQGVQYYVSKSVSDAVAHAETLVNRAETVTDRADAVTTTIAAKLAEAVPPDAAGPP